MKILYDYQIFQMQNYGGVSKYFYNLMNAFEKDEDINYEIGLKYSSNIYLENKFTSKNPSLTNSSNKLIRGGSNKLYEILNRQKSKSFINRNDYDIFHPTYYDTYFLSNLKKPFVSTIYDMNQEKFPEIFGENNFITEQKKKQCESASKILAISENTKQDLISIFNIPEEKIIVTHLSGDLKYTNIDTQLSEKLPEKYVLFIGERKSYKNFNLFFDAIYNLLLEDTSLNIVCTGPKFNEKENKHFLEKKVNNRIHHFSPDEKQMYTIYNKAVCFVYPSLYEGFGIPTLEAMSASCPVLLSNTSSFPEVGGNAALYFDPYDLYSIRIALEKILTDSFLRKELIEKGKIQQLKFTWENTSLITKVVYENIF